MKRSHKKQPGLKLRLVVESGDWIGPGKADLLQGIAETGSISAAGKRMGMSYKRAWGLVETLNNMFSAQLVNSSRGGAEHGGAELTTTGHRVLALYRRMQAKGEETLAKEVQELLELSVIPEQK